MLSDGSFKIFTGSTIAVVLIILTVGSVAWPVLGSALKKGKQNKSA